MARELDTGAVDRATVLEVLGCFDVSATPNPDAPLETLLIKGEVRDSRELPEWIDKDVLFFFRRKFGIPVTSFYHPERARERARMKGATSK